MIENQALDIKNLTKMKGQLNPFYLCFDAVEAY